MSAPPLPRRPFPAPRRRRLLATAVAVLVAVLVAGLLWWFEPTADRAAVGTTFAHDSSLAVRYEPAGTVVVPTARLDFSIGEPLGEVERLQLSGVELDDPVAVARGDAYLAVRWTLAPGPTDGLDLAPPQQYAVHLRVGDRVLDLGADTTEISSYGGAARQPEGSVLVVVPEDAVDEGVLQVEVVYDGLTQALDLRTGEVDAGAAAPYYDDASTSWRPTSGCALLEEPAAAAGIELQRPECSVSSVRVTPYVGGRGWAETGDAPWAVVDVDISYERFGERLGAEETVVVRRTASDVTLDGVAAQVRSVYQDTTSNLLYRELVFVSDGTPEELTIRETAEFYDLPDAGVEVSAADRDELVADLTLPLTG